MLFSGAIICGLFQLSILEEIKVLVWQADLRYWLLAIPLVVVAQVIRTLRVAIATALPVSPNIYRLVSQHLFMSTIMPFRAGELVFPWMLQRDYGVPYSRSIGILLALRFYDLLVILAIGTISTATLLGQLPEYVRYENILFVAGFSAIVMLLVLPAAIGKMLDLLVFLSKKWERLYSLSKNLNSSVQFLRSPRVHIKTILTTIVIWVVNFQLLFLGALSVVPNLDWTLTMTASSASVVVASQPISGFAGLGTFQAAWIFVLYAKGVGMSAAVISGIAAHVLQILGNTLNAAAAALFIPRINPPQDNLRA